MKKYHSTCGEGAVSSAILQKSTFSCNLMQYISLTQTSAFNNRNKHKK